MESSLPIRFEHRAAGVPDWGEQRFLVSELITDLQAERDAVQAAIHYRHVALSPVELSVYPSQ